PAAPSDASSATGAPSTTGSGVTVTVIHPPTDPLAPEVSA
ncbi:hypothetical protein GA0115259_105174, partial [Streptomyces sp. MnatMP-M17]